MGRSSHNLMYRILSTAAVLSVSITICLYFDGARFNVSRDTQSINRPDQSEGCDNIRRSWKLGTKTLVNSGCEATSILAELDLEIGRLTIMSADTDCTLERYRLEKKYLNAIIKLGDARAAECLASRGANADTNYSRFLYYSAASQLGEHESLNAFAREFGQGKVNLAASIVERYCELGDIIEGLSNCDSVESNEALYTLADSRHPLHEEIVGILGCSLADPGDVSPWFNHPYCISILGAGLERMECTNLKCIANHEFIEYSNGNIRRVYNTPKFLRPFVEEEKCIQLQMRHIAGINLSRLLAGIIPYHPLMENASERLDCIRNFVKEYKGNFRRVSFSKAMVLDSENLGTTFSPNVPSCCAQHKNVVSGRTASFFGFAPKFNSISCP